MNKKPDAKERLERIFQQAVSKHGIAPENRDALIHQMALGLTTLGLIRECVRGWVNERLNKGEGASPNVIESHCLHDRAAVPIQHGPSPSARAAAVTIASRSVFDRPLGAFNLTPRGATFSDWRNLGKKSAFMGAFASRVMAISGWRDDDKMTTADVISERDFKVLRAEVYRSLDALGITKRADHAEH